MSLDSHQPAASEHTANMNVRPDLTVNSTDSDTRAREDPNEVSYTIVPVSHELVDQVLQSVATAINLRLSLEQNQPFPFVEFDSFSAALKQDKVFLYGPGGSGKSRSIFELLSRGILHFDRIIIVNPRNNVGTESGRIPLAELVAKFAESDAVIWDNFPDDLIKRDAANCRDILELLSSRSLKKLLVALKPKFLEVLWQVPSAIPEISSHRISYDRERVKNIVRNYGTALEKYRHVYDRHIAGDLDRISRLLWQREPTPLTIQDYYVELSSKVANGEKQTELDASAEAERLLRSTSYYEHQFALLTGFQERRSDVEFLYVLKLCYELGIARDAARVEHLQNEIFGSNPPMAPNEKLSTWVYLSGSYYSMHDVCREAIRFTDFVRLKVLSYLAGDPDKVIGAGNKDGQSAGHQLAMYLGRNLQHIPRESLAQYAPDTLSAFLKRNPRLNKAFGQGAGEVFDSLDDELQNSVLVRIDMDVPFATGLAETLGLNFPSLDPEKRRAVLQKIYSGLLFARYFGQSLGRQITQLQGDIRREIIAHTEWNPQFADGIGMGIGYVYSSLDEDTRKLAFSLAEKNIDMSRGLGFGFGLEFARLDQETHSMVLSIANRNSEFDKGLGMGIGELFHDKIPEALKSDVLERRAVRSEFALGLGISVARANAEKSYDDLLELIDSDAELAHGLGMGYGASVVYLAKESLGRLFSLGEENERFDLGLGSGIGFLFKHLPQQLQSKFLDRANSNNEFDQGIGFGLGFTWIYQNADMRRAAYERALTHSAFSYGLGYGIGYHFRYVENPLKDDIFKKGAQDGEFAKGLGYGLGYSFPFLDDGAKKIVLEKATNDPRFSLGFGIGIGRISRYLAREEKELLFARASENIEFGKGLGLGIGRYVAMYASREFQREIFSDMKKSSQMAYGLGAGLGYTYTHISVEFQNRVMGQMAMENGEFARGLGVGFGVNIKYLPPSLRDRLFSLAEQNIRFAQGLGEGTGAVIGYVSDGLRDRIMAAAGPDSAFARGIGEGIGSVCAYFDDDLREDLLRRGDSNQQLAAGLGAGIGAVIPYLQDHVKKTCFDYASTNPEFLAGLGEGFATPIKYSPSLSQDGKVRAMLQLAGFVAGLGRGYASHFTAKVTTFDPESASRALLAQSSLQDEFLSGLGQGLGANFAGLSDELHDEIFRFCQNNARFAGSFGYGVAHQMQYLSSTLQGKIISMAGKAGESFARGLGEGIGHAFVFLPSSVQEKALGTSAENKAFSTGLGYSLGRIFRHLDSILQEGVLRLQDSNHDFAHSLGQGLGVALPILQAPLQETLIQKLEEAGDGPSLSRGLAEGLRKSVKYMERSFEDKVVEISRRNTYVRDALFATTESQGTIFSDRYHDFPAVAISPVGSLAGSDPMGASGEILFSGQRANCCVCIVDMVNSTGVTADLNDLQLGRYYAIFLNAMAVIAKNFGAKIIKNAGDSLLIYFPRTIDAGETSSFKDVLECGMTMIAAHGAINSRLLNEKMPSVNYRISADYGRVEIARSASSQSDDLFGPVMNLTSKINSRARPNGMAIGHELYDLVKGLEDFAFEIADDNIQDDQDSYAVYHVKSRRPGNIINPFKRTPGNS